MNVAKTTKVEKTPMREKKEKPTWLELRKEGNI